MELILASNSPRRRELLTEYRFAFRVIPSDYNETPLDLSPTQTVKAFALGKATSVFNALSSQEKANSVVLGADTVVCLEGEILGKPKSKEEARQMLKSLSGKEHFVITGYCFVTESEQRCYAEKTKVVFHSLNDSLIEEYVATGKPMDKAGAYGIQDGFNLVKECVGSYNNVVGLPVEVFKEELFKILNK